jgi:hypothetical protein
MNYCVNHPQREAISICHGCSKYYCELCLVEGPEYYYCKNPRCQELLKKELIPELPFEIVCPNCSALLELSGEERIIRKFHCVECDSFINYNYDPPKILKPESFDELLYSMNQGDISVIKSMLDNSEIDYFVFGENFFNIDPLIQPARIFVLSTRLEEARELLKNFDQHIFGLSNSVEAEE